MQQPKVPLTISKAQLALLALGKGLYKAMDITYISPSDIGRTGGLSEIANEYAIEFKDNPLLQIANINPLNAETDQHGPPSRYMSSQFGFEPASIKHHHVFSGFLAYKLLNQIRPGANLDIDDHFIDEVVALCLSHDIGAKTFKHFDRSQFAFLYSTDHEDEWLNHMRTERAEQILHEARIDERRLEKIWRNKESEFLIQQTIEKTSRLFDGPIVHPIWIKSNERERVIRDGSIKIGEEGDLSLVGSVKGYELKSWNSAIEVKVDLETASDYTQIREAATFMDPREDPRRLIDVLRRACGNELVNVCSRDELRQLLNTSDLGFVKGAQKILKRYATTRGRELRATREWVNYWYNPLSVKLPECIWSYTYASSEKQLPAPSLQTIGRAEGVAREVIRDKINSEVSPIFDLWQRTLELFIFNLRPRYFQSGGFYSVTADESKRIKEAFGGEKNWRIKGIFEFSQLLSDAIEGISGFGPIVAQHETDMETLKLGRGFPETKKWPATEIRNLQDEMEMPPTPAELLALSRNGINGR
jgi:hypothetical protein